MSNTEKEEEEIFMNPGKIEQIQKAKEDLAESKRSKLLDENYILQKEKQFFDKQERTVHKDIIPAKDRIVEYKRKSFGKLFQQKLDDRPMSAVQSSQGLGDVTT